MSVSITFASPTRTPLEALTAYDGEIRHMLDAIVRRRHSTDVTIEDAEAVARLLEAERDSLQTGLPIRFGE